VDDLLQGHTGLAFDAQQPFALPLGGIVTFRRVTSPLRQAVVGVAPSCSVTMPGSKSSPNSRRVAEQRSIGPPTVMRGDGSGVSLIIVQLAWWPNESPATSPELFADRPDIRSRPGRRCTAKSWRSNVRCMIQFDVGGHPGSRSRRRGDPLPPVSRRGGHALAREAAARERHSNLRRSATWVPNTSGGVGPSRISSSPTFACRHVGRAGDGPYGPG
jgi:hypothetical protein